MGSMDEILDFSSSFCLPIFSRLSTMSMICLCRLLWKLESKKPILSIPINKDWLQHWNFESQKVRQEMSDILEYRKTPVLNIRLKSILAKYMWKQKLAQEKGERNIRVKISQLNEKKWSFLHKPVPFQNKQKPLCSILGGVGREHACSQHCGSNVRKGKSEALTTENMLEASNFLSWSTTLKHDQRWFGHNWEAISHVYNFQLK